MEKIMESEKLREKKCAWRRTRKEKEKKKKSVRKKIVTSIGIHFPNQWNLYSDTNDDWQRQIFNERISPKMQYIHSERQRALERTYQYL